MRVVAALVAALVLAGLLVFGVATLEQTSPEPPTLGRATAPESNSASAYVGSAQCMGCHASESQAWRRSHHAKAMQPAADETMPAGISGITLSSPSGPVKLLRKDDNTYSAAIAGSDGKVAEFRISYTFGIDPLQEYLVAVPGGRLQVLPVARDTRPPERNGQRWFSLYPDQHFASGDPLYWMGRDQNWNFMCADCHSTNLRRHYDSATDTYATTFSEVNVACEACHGPASRHVGSMRKGGGTYEPDRAAGPAAGIAGPAAGQSGLSVELSAARSVQWGLWSKDQRIASPRGDIRAATAQSAVCFPCHARRQPLTQNAAPGEALLDNYLPQLIESGVYHADGQIDAEDFEFGSFVQSRMYARGVTCANCHDVHSLRLRAVGNALCTQCHRADIYDRSAHHHHPADSSGAQCINCHMPEKTYMIVHSRRDHSFRVPMPQLTAALGTPNTCNQCHRDKKPSWAVAAIRSWTHRPTTEPSAHFASVIQDAWGGAKAPAELLERIAAAPSNAAQRGPPSESLPGFVRASLLAQPGSQGQSLPPMALQALMTAAIDPDPLVRLGMARGLSALSAADAIQVGTILLHDPTRAVRIETARALAGAGEAELGPTAAAGLGAAIDELISAERASSERPESHVNLAQLFARLGRDSEARDELGVALRLDSRFVPALVNLADLDRSRGRENEAEQHLRRAMEVAPLAAAPVHALGLLEVRRGQRAQALALLANAAQLEPMNARYTYVYAVALAESGRLREARAVLNNARRRLPKDASLSDLQQQLASPQSQE